MAHPPPYPFYEHDTESTDPPIVSDTDTSAPMQESQVPLALGARSALRNGSSVDRLRTQPQFLRHRTVFEVLITLGLAGCVFIVHDVPYLLKTPYWLDEAWVVVSTRTSLGRLSRNHFGYPDRLDLPDPSRTRKWRASPEVAATHLRSADGARGVRLQSHASAAADHIRTVGRWGRPPRARHAGPR